MDKVTSIDEYRPHFASFDPVTKNTHVIPIELVESVMNGETDIQECEQWQAMTRALLHSLLLECGIERD